MTVDGIGFNLDDHGDVFVGATKAWEWWLIPGGGEVSSINGFIAFGDEFFSQLELFMLMAQPQPGQTATTFTSVADANGAGR